MTKGQKIKIYGDKRSFRSNYTAGTIIAVEKRFIVVKYNNYTESFLKVDVENNLDRSFEVG